MGCRRAHGRTRRVVRGPSENRWGVGRDAEEGHQLFPWRNGTEEGNVRRMQGCLHMFGSATYSSFNWSNFAHTPHPLHVPHERPPLQGPLSPTPSPLPAWSLPLPHPINSCQWQQFWGRRASPTPLLLPLPPLPPPPLSIASRPWLRCCCCVMVVWVASWRRGPRRARRLLRDGRGKCVTPMVTSATAAAAVTGRRRRWTTCGCWWGPPVGDADVFNTRSWAAAESFKSHHPADCSGATGAGAGGVRKTCVANARWGNEGTRRLVEAPACALWLVETRLHQRVNNCSPLHNASTDQTTLCACFMSSPNACCAHERTIRRGLAAGLLVGSLWRSLRLSTS